MILAIIHRIVFKAIRPNRPNGIRVSNVKTCFTINKIPG
jgi:hypothetical protein